MLGCGVAEEWHGQHSGCCSQEEREKSRYGKPFFTGISSAIDALYVVDTVYKVRDP